ncbi:MAG: hypothetical protein ABH879_06075 [archaeon]
MDQPKHNYVTLDVTITDVDRQPGPGRLAVTVERNDGSGKTDTVNLTLMQVTSLEEELGAELDGMVGRNVTGDYCDGQLKSLYR